MQRGINNWHFGETCLNLDNEASSNNVTNLLAVMDVWGPCEVFPADLDGDGFVAVVDLLEVVGNRG